MPCPSCRKFFPGEIQSVHQEDYCMGLCGASCSCYPMFRNDTSEEQVIVSARCPVHRPPGYFPELPELEGGMWDKSNPEEDLTEVGPDPTYPDSSKWRFFNPPR